MPPASGAATIYTLRQYRPPQKKEFLRDYPTEARADAKLLSDELTGLQFHFATAFQESDGSRSVQIEFKGNERIMWVRAKGDEAKAVLDQTREIVAG